MLPFTRIPVVCARTLTLFVIARRPEDVHGQRQGPTQEVAESERNFRRRGTYSGSATVGFIPALWSVRGRTSSSGAEAIPTGTYLMRFGRNVYRVLGGVTCQLPGVRSTPSAGWRRASTDCRSSRRDSSSRSCR
jgi:hypothetical protein